jgi:predicted transglutaminase-like cysteine proteinase
MQTGKRLNFLAALWAILFFASISHAAQQDPFVRLFGYEAFAAGRHNFPAYIEKHWQRVLQAEQAKPCLQRDASCLPTVDASHWRHLADKAPSMDELSLLRTVNAFFNKYPLVSDMENYGVQDYWPTLADFFAKQAGDCKAYTLAKYFALRALGTPDSKLRIVVAHLPERKANHALLAVSTAKGVFILDDLVRPTDLILPQEKVKSRFIPLFMLNETGRWTFKQYGKMMRAKPSKPQ